MGISLYELSKDYEAVIEGGMVYDEETGEVIWDTTNLDELEAALSDKLEACGIVVKNMIAEIAALSDEKKRLDRRKKALEAKVCRLKDYVAGSIGLVGGKLSTPKVALSTMRTEVVVVDEDMVGSLPPEFVSVRTAPNKTAIKKALKAGKAVEGAELAENVSLIVR